MRFWILGAALVLVLASPPAVGARAGHSAAFSYWRVASATGTVVVHVSGTDPDLLQVDADVSARWHTTRSVDRLTFPWPARPVAPLNDTETFGDLEKVKASIVGSAKGTTLGTNPQAFSCTPNDAVAPATFFNQPGEIPITGGSLGGAKLGIGVQHVNPYAVFDSCPGAHGLPVSTLVSSERIDWTKATFKQIGGAALRKGRKNERLTVTIRETAPVDNSTATVGTAVSTAVLHLVFVGAA